jgi:hypothetical protein
MAVYHEEGEYAARILSARLGKSKTKETPQIEIELDILWRKLNSSETEDVTPSRYPPMLYMSLTDATMGDPDNPGWVAGVLRHLGFANDWEDFGSIINKQVEVYNRHESKIGESESYDRWSIITPRQPKAPPTRSDVRQAANQWGKLFNKPVNETTNAAQQPTAPPGPTKPESGEEKTRPARPSRGKKPHPNSIPEGVTAANASKDDIPF